jgi:hypothetical protein
MTKKRTELSINKDGFRTLWFINGETVCVDVYKGNECIINWAYPKMRGYGGLRGQCMLWLDQAILQAKTEMSKKGK